MTDYLARPEEQEEALLEQAKRLEQALYALTAAGAENIPQATADAGEDLGDHRSGPKVERLQPGVRPRPRFGGGGA